MSYIIENNSFTIDTYGVRSTRLLMISNNIDDYEVELEIEADMLSWAQDTYQNWQDELADRSVERGQKLEAYQTRDEASEALYDKYVRAKELLISRYGEDDQNLATYGVDVPVPTRKPDIINKAYELIRGNEVQTAAGDPKALPAGMINNLKTLADDAADKQEIAKKEKSEMKEATQTLHNLYDTDSDRLSSLLNWVLMYWAKNDPRLELFGFVPYTAHGGGQTPDAPQNLAYDMGSGQFSWDAVETATSYQLAYRATGSDDDWEEAYKGADTSVTFDPGNGDWEFRVRARNEHGYGDWSILIAVSIGLQPPQIWELVYNPSTNKVTLQWHASIGADYHDVYQSVVPLGQGAGDFTMIESIAGQVYQHDVSTYDVREYYYVIARNASGSSDPSEIVFVDVAAV